MSILALRAAGMGDLITAVPALRALGRHSAAERTTLSVAAPRWLHPLVRLIPGVRAAVPVADLYPLVAERPELAVNLHGSGPESHRALLGTAPRTMVAYQAPGWGLGPRWVDDEPERERWCRLVRWAGIDADPTQVGIHTPPITPRVRDAVVVHLGAGHPSRVWQPQQFVDLIPLLPRGQVVLTGLARDLPLARGVASLTGVAPRNVLAGRLDMLSLVSLVAAARLVISTDTGIAHLAVATGTPSVTIFGSESVRRWGPPPSLWHRTVRAPGPHPSVADMPIGPVVRESLDLLSVNRRGGGRTPDSPQWVRVEAPAT